MKELFIIRSSQYRRPVPSKFNHEIKVVFISHSVESHRSNILFHLMKKGSGIN